MALREPVARRENGRHAHGNEGDGYTEKLGRALCEQIAAGKGLRVICQTAGMPSTATLFRWLDAHPDFREQYARAREIQAELQAEEIVALSDEAQKAALNAPDPKIANALVQAIRLRVEARKWTAAKLLPKKYGDRITNEHTGDGGGPIRFTLERIGGKQ